MVSGVHEIFVSLVANAYLPSTINSVSAIVVTETGKPCTPDHLQTKTENRFKQP